MTRRYLISPRLLAILAVCASATTLRADVRFLDDDAPLGGDGQSWLTAYRYLQDAFAVSVWGDEIRVAGGTYTPDQDEAGSVTPGDRGAAFNLVDGVAVRGGYRGCPGADCSGGDPDERDIRVYESILSGDLAGDDVEIESPEDLPTEPTRAENSYHVVISYGTPETTVLDGLTVTGGHANGSDPHNAGGGMYNLWGILTLRECTFSANSAEYGGGMFNIENSDPTLTDCTFTGNSATRDGGGMCNTKGFGVTANPRLTNCTFSGNSAASHGGGMYNDQTSPTLTGCTFSGNSAQYGGGISYYYSYNPTLTDCTFVGNSATGGGGVRNFFSSPTLKNCTFSWNSAHAQGGGLFNADGSHPELTDCRFTGNSAWSGGGISNEWYSLPTLANCIFSENSAANHGGGLENLFGTPTLTNCTFWGNSAVYHGGGVHNYGSPTLTNCILWGDEPDEIYNPDSSSAPTVSFSDIEGGLPAYTIDGGGNIAWPPLFVPGPAGCYYLSQTAAGQAEQSPCADGGSDAAVNLDLDTLTTRSDEGVDMGLVDMGHHYPVTGEPLIMGDYNRDGLLDLTDFSQLHTCFTGPDPEDLSPCCRLSDFDFDTDVDLLDIADFQVNFTGGG